MDVIVLVPVDVLEVPGRKLARLSLDDSGDFHESKNGNLQSIVAPLDFFDNVKTAMHNELVHMPRFLSKSCYAIAASFGCAEFDLEQRVVPRSNDGEVVGH